MTEVRFWQAQDLPYLRWFAVLNAWQILPPEDRAVASVAAVAASSETNLINVLSSPGGTALVALDGGRPIGYMLIAIQTDDRTGQSSGYLADVYLEPEYRKKGIATKFHELGEQYLAQIGIRRATLWTHAHNPLGQASAVRRGYNLWGVMMSRLLV